MGRAKRMRRRQGRLGAAAGLRRRAGVHIALSIDVCAALEQPLHHGRLVVEGSVVQSREPLRGSRDRRWGNRQGVAAAAGVGRGGCAARATGLLAVAARAGLCWLPQMAARARL
jgi:hypothetical protein